jgi:hypothetical protein
MSRHDLRETAGPAQCGRAMPSESRLRAGLPAPQPSHRRALSNSSSASSRFRRLLSADSLSNRVPFDEQAVELCQVALLPRLQRLDQLHVGPVSRPLNNYAQNVPEIPCWNAPSSCSRAKSRFKA